MGDVIANPSCSYNSMSFKNKQNTTRDIEIKNIVKIATGEWGGDSRERGL